MASLYSAQTVIAARQQLNKQHEELAVHLLQNEDKNTHHKAEKHHPAHFKDTVHQKCKHHQEQTEGVLHKKLHKLIDHAHQEQKDSSHRNFRRLKDQREEIELEMKKWTKFIQACLKGQHKFSEKELHEQHSGLYKWMLFIEELFRSYQDTLKTQTSIQTLQQQPIKIQATRQEDSSNYILSPRIQHKPKQSHQIKLPHLPTQEGMEHLQARISQLEKQLHQTQITNRGMLKQINDLTHSIESSEEKMRVRNERIKKTEMNISNLLKEMENFNNSLLVDLSEPQKLKEYPQRIQQNLNKIKQYQQLLNVDKK